MRTRSGITSSGCSVLVLTQNSFRDPLFHGPVVSCLKTLNSAARYAFHVISYEQEQYRIPANEAAAFDAELGVHAIYRHPLTWGRGSLLRKAWELLRGFWLAARLRVRHRTVAVFALANVAGAFAYLIGRALGMKVIVFTFEPHSEFMAECGVWSRRSLKYQLLRRMERRMGQRADYILTGTTHMVERLRAEGSRAHVLRVPSCVDEDVFDFRPDARETVRQRLKAAARPIFVYVGKFGDLYYKDEIAVLCAALRGLVPAAFFLVLTPNPLEEIRTLFRRHGIEEGDDLHLTYSTIETVPDWLSAADMGIVAVPPLPAQRFRSPIKVGEYLDCGLPYIVCRGVSEDDVWAERHGVGVVVEAFTAAAVSREADRIRGLLGEDKDSLRKRCREAGVAYRGKAIAVTAFGHVFQEVCGAR